MASSWDEAHVGAPQSEPVLDALIRERLGRRLQAMYEPIIDEPLDPRLAKLLLELEQARAAIA